MPGGDMCEKLQAFLEWANSYDTGDETIRSRRLHERWLSTLPCPIVCIEGEYTIEEQIDALLTGIQQ